MISSVTSTTTTCFYSQNNNDDDDDTTARSSFGTKEYWDEVYQGRGDFPADEYSWYYGFDSYERIVKTYIQDKSCKIFIPGIGNDPILLSLIQKGYTHLTATDYSTYAIERQEDLLSYYQYPFKSQNDDDADNDDIDNDDDHDEMTIQLRCMDARKMDPTWTNRFDIILEKGALDAIYLSGDGNLERTVQELERIIKKPGGILISISGVVPDELRRTVFQNWTWLQDGSNDLKAGCFVLQK